jgi:hypothetical protein
MSLFYDRNLVSYEGVEGWHNRLVESGQLNESPHHKVILVEDWDKVDLGRHWGLAFVDHEAHRRASEMQRLAIFADIVVAHDTSWRSERHYKYKTVWEDYEYVKHFKERRLRPQTTICSNLIDVTVW